MSKLEKANKIICNYIKENYGKENWRYIDFVEENRFFDEIERDQAIDCATLSAEEVAERCLSKICEIGILEIAQIWREARDDL